LVAAHGRGGGGGGGLMSKMKVLMGKKNASDALPSAATCFNTLKLPVYSSETVMAQKLRQAISEAPAGFEVL
jgi:hypothetical protein